MLPWSNFIRSAPIAGGILDSSSNGTDFFAFVS